MPTRRRESSSASSSSPFASRANFGTDVGRASRELPFRSACGSTADAPMCAGGGVSHHSLVDACDEVFRRLLSFSYCDCNLADISKVSIL